MVEGRRGWKEVSNRRMGGSLLPIRRSSQSRMDGRSEHSLRRGFGARLSSLDNRRHSSRRARSTNTRSADPSATRRRMCFSSSWRTSTRLHSSRRRVEGAAGRTRAGRPSWASRTRHAHESDQPHREKGSPYNTPAGLPFLHASFLCVFPLHLSFLSVRVVSLPAVLAVGRRLGRRLPSSTTGRPPAPAAPASDAATRPTAEQSRRPPAAPPPLFIGQTTQHTTQTHTYKMSGRYETETGVRVFSCLVLASLWCRRRRRAHCAAVPSESRYLAPSTRHGTAHHRHARATRLHPPLLQSERCDLVYRVRVFVTLFTRGVDRRGGRRAHGRPLTGTQTLTHDGRTYKPQKHTHTHTHTHTGDQCLHKSTLLCRRWSSSLSGSARVASVPLRSVLGVFSS